jgi:uncharacterized protein YkwD
MVFTSDNQEENSVLIVSLTLLSSMLMAQASSVNANLATIPPESQQILELVNHTRAGAGASPLQWDAALAEAARQHGMRMAAEGSAEHHYAGEPAISERASQSGAHFSLIAEDVAVGSTPADIHEEWIKSPDNRTNICSIPKWTA